MIILYEELIKQDMNEAGSKFITLEMKDEIQSEEMMQFLISTRENNISYTEVWKQKEKILKN